MAKIEDWHIGLSRLVCGQALHGGYQNINELIQAGAQLIADSVPHAPASTELHEGRPHTPKRKASKKK